MKLMEKPKTFRLTKETKRHISELALRFPEKYASESHVIRCAIMKLYKEEILKCQTAYIVEIKPKMEKSFISDANIGP